VSPVGSSARYEHPLFLWSKKPKRVGIKKFDLGFIERKARETGFLIRKRKLNPYYLALILLFGISNHLKPTMEEIHRRYIDFDDNPKILTLKCQVQT
jgi:hypothetical protein